MQHHGNLLPWRLFLSVLLLVCGMAAVGLHWWILPDSLQLSAYTTLSQVSSAQWHVPEWWAVDFASQRQEIRERTPELPAVSAPTDSVLTLATPATPGPSISVVPTTAQTEASAPATMAPSSSFDAQIAVSVSRGDGHIAVPRFVHTELGSCVFDAQTEISPSSADAFVLLAMWALPATRYGPPHQIWFSFCMEARARYPVDEAALHHLVDFVVSPHIDMNDGRYIPATYMVPLERMRSAVESPNQKGVAVVISNCNWAPNNRTNYTRELMEYLPVTSFGRCLNNAQMARSAGADENRIDQKLNALRQFQFYLAFENSNEEDYVTEKFFDGFLAGTVPVYMGAPNIDRYAPGTHSFIKTSDFASPAALAEHLLVLMREENKALVQEYHAWRHKPVPERVRDWYARGTRDPYKSMCEVTLASKKSRTLRQ